MDRHQQIRHELHLRPGAEWPQEIVRPCERFQHGHALAIRAARTARINHQILDSRLRSGAAQRAIEQDDIALGEERACLFLNADRQGTGFDDDLAPRPGDCKLGRDFMQRLRRRQRCDHDRGALRHIARAPRRATARVDQAGAARRQHVVAQHRKSGRDDIGRYRRAHDAQSDYADRLSCWHAEFPQGVVARSKTSRTASLRALPPQRTAFR